MKTYTDADIAALRADGLAWPRIALLTGHSRWACQRAVARHQKAGSGVVPLSVSTGAAEAEQDARSKSLLVRLPTKVTNLPELIAALQVDMEEWKVKGFTGNAWQGQTPEGVETFLQVKAHFERDRERELAAALAALHEAAEDMATHAPQYEPVQRRDLSAGNPVLYTVHINDPHLGMLAWGPETGADYDIKIARSDYARAGEHLLALAHIYPVERIMLVIGNDMLHADNAGINRRGGATTAGTPQDVDGRLAKQFSTARKVAVNLIDKARIIAPVDVMVVPGNHDREQMYRLGEVLTAWYRNDSEVTVSNSPSKRSFYSYGRNAFMLTHGEEYRRQRDNIVTIMATECPAQMWVDSVYREILTGHNHVKLEGRYWPTSDMTESRGIRTRSLPGLTPEDAWHTEEGYKHVRTATSIAYRKSGGVVGLHEFNLFNEEAA